MLSEREIEDLIKFSGVQHNEGTDIRRDSRPACMTMDKYLAHRTEILSLAWGYFKLQRIVERGINPPVTVDLRPGAINTWPRLHAEISEYIQPRQDEKSWFAWPLAIGLVVCGFALGTFLTWFLLSK